MAARSGHLLLIGQTGTGKELVAQAIHALSNRSQRTLIARNAAVFPPGLVDAELFGNVPNYPNVGSPERPGLIGQAQGSTLFLDEIGELPHDLQAHLLRVLDSGGEYQRLGESRTRAADVRIVGATARSPEQLRLDFGARFRLRLDVLGLDERRENIALVARHLLTQGAKSDPLTERLFAAKGHGALARPDKRGALLAQLCQASHARARKGHKSSEKSGSPGARDMALLLLLGSHGARPVVAEVLVVRRRGAAFGCLWWQRCNSRSRLRWRSGSRRGNCRRWSGSRGRRGFLHLPGQELRCRHALPCQ